MNKLTIITVVYNAKEDLIYTIESIKEQKDQNFEYIVIDGGSTDGTLEIIEKEQRVDKYISELDKGIYDAMNKGINIASNDIILFLNAGDRLYNNEVTKKVIAECEIYTFDIAYGDVVLVNKNKILKRQPNILTKKYLYTNNLCHQSMFFNKRIFNNIGFFDNNEKIFADYKFLLKSFKNKSKYHHFKFIICEYDNINGVSSKLDKKKAIRERARIICEVYDSLNVIQFLITNLFIKPFGYLNIYFNKKFRMDN